MVQYSKQSLIYARKKSTKEEQQNFMFSLRYYTKPKRNFFLDHPVYVGIELFLPVKFVFAKQILISELKFYTTSTGWSEETVDHKLIIATITKHSTPTIALVGKYYFKSFEFYTRLWSMRWTKTVESHLRFIMDGTSRCFLTAYSAMCFRHIWAALSYITH